MKRVKLNRQEKEIERALVRGEYEPAAGEAWLFRNKRALALVRQGLEDAKRGRLVRVEREAKRRIKRAAR